MLTEDDLAAIIGALNLGFIQRLILVGDPNQLPPIGPGRPFADLVSLLDRAAEAPPGSPQQAADGALARLQVQLRAAGGSKALALAAWFTDDTQPVDADRILAELDGDPALLPGESAAMTRPGRIGERAAPELERRRRGRPSRGVRAAAGEGAARRRPPDRRPRAGVLEVRRRSCGRRCSHSWPSRSARTARPGSTQRSASSTATSRSTTTPARRGSRSCPRYG